MFQTPRTTLYFPPKDLQAAFWAGVESSLCPESQPVEEPLQRGAFLLGPQTLWPSSS